MRGADGYNESLFSTVRLEEFVPQAHPLRQIRMWLDEALSKMDAKFSAMYEVDVKGGRPSIAPEKLMRAMLLQVLYSIRSERQLVEQISYNLLFRWFVGLTIEDEVWSHSVFSKNRDRLLEFDAVTDLFNATVEASQKRGPAFERVTCPQQTGPVRTRSFSEKKANMKKRFTEGQNIGFLKEAEAGMPVKELCRKHSFSDASLYAWRAKFGGMKVSEARRLKDLETENARLKKLLAEAMLDMEARKIVVKGRP
ncbi:transposase/transposase-like protein [Burkholderia sp. 567]|jgi:transposase/transposase-like protein